MENSVSRQSSIDLFKSLTIVKEDSVSRQSSVDLFRYGWSHLHPAIVKEDSVSRQYRLIQIWLDSLTTSYSSKGGQCQPSIYRSIQIWLESLTICNSKGGQCQS
jgi:hypothetical protein